MRATWALAIALAGCTAKDEPSLMLEGPDQVTVDALGEVDGPRAVLEDGEAPQGLVWSSTKPQIATVDGSKVTAIAPGEALIQGTWRNQTVVWHLVVDPAVQVRFVKAPRSLAMGAKHTFEVEVTMGDKRVPASDVVWSARPESVVQVDGSGTVLAVAPGTGWITARQSHGEAMVEVVVTP